MDHFGAGTKPRVQQRTPQASSRQRASSLSRGPTTTPSAYLHVSDSARERHTCVCISGTRDTMARPRRGRARFLTIPTYENTRLDVLLTVTVCSIRRQGSPSGHRLRLAFCAVVSEHCGCLFQAMRRRGARSSGDILHLTHVRSQVRRVARAHHCTGNGLPPNAKN